MFTGRSLTSSPASKAPPALGTCLEGKGPGAWGACLTPPPPSTFTDCWGACRRGAGVLGCLPQPQVLGEGLAHGLGKGGPPACLLILWPASDLTTCLGIFMAAHRGVAGCWNAEARSPGKPGWAGFRQTAPGSGQEPRLWPRCWHGGPAASGPVGGVMFQVLRLLDLL